MWPFLLARKQLFPPRRFPVFAFVSILGVACGVTALLVVQTVMNSFGEEHRKRIRESIGDVVVYHQRQKPIEAVSGMVEGMAVLPGVEAVAAYIEGGVVMQAAENDIRFFGVRGIDVRREGRVTPLDEYMRGGAGNIADLDDERVILGSRLAASIGVGQGDRIEIQSPAKLAKTMQQEEVSLPKELEVCGIIHTGFTEADEKLMLVTLRTARDLFLMPPDSATAVHLKLKDSSRAEVYATNLDARLDFPLRALPWTVFRKAFLDAVAMEKQMLFLLMFIITLVASFSIGSTLFSHVVRRTREIGLISALGGSPMQILRIFLTQGFLIGVIGFILGVGLTFLILHFRQEIVLLMGAQETLVNQYKFAEVPLHYNFHDFIKAAVLTIILMTGASLLPAVWAARRKPSEAMRDVN